MGFPVFGFLTKGLTQEPTPKIVRVQIEVDADVLEGV
jgi:hypothetical protein